MATLIGSEGSVSELEWAQIGYLGNEYEVINDSALVPSVGGGTREVVVGTGWVKCCNCMAKFTTTTSKLLGGNSSGTDRVDLIVAEFNWGNSTSALGTPANSVLIQTVVGSGPTAPARSASAGVLWQVPIAQATVPSGGGAITVTDVRPLRRYTERNPWPGTGENQPINAVLATTATSTKVISTVTVIDPGYRYRLGWAAQVDFANQSQGHALIDVTANNTVAGPAGRTDTGFYMPAIIPYYVDEPRTGGAVVRLRMTPVGNPPAAMASVNNSFTYFMVVTIPG